MAMAGRAMAGCLVALAVLGARWQPGEGASAGRGQRGRRVLKPWAMRVTNCGNLRAALETEGLLRIIVMGPIACGAEDWPEPVIVSWDVEIMGVSAWEANPMIHRGVVASIDLTGVRTAVIVTEGAFLNIHSLVLRQDELDVGLSQFRLVKAHGIYQGMVVAARSCGDDMDAYMADVTGWDRPKGLLGDQRTMAMGSKSFLVRDGAAHGSVVHNSTLRLCESVFECGASDGRIEEVFESDLVNSLCL